MALVGDNYAVASAEIILDYCNEFVLIYCESLRDSSDLVPSQQSLIESTERLCEWLYDNGQTTSLLQRQTLN